MAWEAWARSTWPAIISSTDGWRSRFAAHAADREDGLEKLGEEERAFEWAERARAVAPREPPCLYNLACFYAIAGRGETALDCLETALEEGFGQIEWVTRDPDLDSIRDEPRFEKLLAALRARARDRMRPTTDEPE